MEDDRARGDGRGKRRLSKVRIRGILQSLFVQSRIAANAKASSNFEIGQVDQLTYRKQHRGRNRRRTQKDGRVEEGSGTA